MILNNMAIFSLFCPDYFIFPHYSRSGKRFYIYTHTIHTQTHVALFGFELLGKLIKAIVETIILKIMVFNFMNLML